MRHASCFLLPSYPCNLFSYNSLGFLFKRIVREIYVVQDQVRKKFKFSDKLYFGFNTCLEYYINQNIPLSFVKSELRGSAYLITSVETKFTSANSCYSVVQLFANCKNAEKKRGDIECDTLPIEVVQIFFNSL